VVRPYEKFGAALTYCLGALKGRPYTEKQEDVRTLRNWGEICAECKDGTGEFMARAHAEAATARSR
jgi:hypothetical protein